MIKVLFVCLGNICRSPTADGIFRGLVQRAGLQSRIEVDSAGTGAWHVGNGPDPRTQRAAEERGYDLSMLRARQAIEADFHEFDLILAMDHANYSELMNLQPNDSKASLRLFLSYDPEAGVEEVPDPYYGGEDGFEQVLDLVENAGEKLLADLIQQHNL